VLETVLSDELQHTVLARHLLPQAPTACLSRKTALAQVVTHARHQLARMVLKESPAYTSFRASQVACTGESPRLRRACAADGIDDF